MTNKKLGNDFEQEVCEILAKHGFWTHNMAQNKSGQPADIIAVKNMTAYLIDAKVCSSRGFALSRMEENQDLAMDLWMECGNGTGWFAIKFPIGEIYMVNHLHIKAYQLLQSTLSFAEIKNIGVPIERWIERWS